MPRKLSRESRGESNVCLRRHYVKEGKLTYAQALRNHTLSAMLSKESGTTIDTRAYASSSGSSSIHGPTAFCDTGVWRNNYFICVYVVYRRRKNHVLLMFMILLTLPHQVQGKFYQQGLLNQQTIHLLHSVPISRVYFLAMIYQMI